MIALDSKKFIKDYWRDISGKAKTPEMLKQYMNDEELIGHIMAYEKPFPCYELLEEDMICEDDKVVVRGRVQAIHKGDLMGMPPTGKKIDLPFSVIYQLGDEKIIKSWLFVDQMELMNQLGLAANN